MARQWNAVADKLRGWLLHNWPIKATALVLAAILWAAVAAQEPTSRLIPVDVQLEMPAGRMLVGELPAVHALYTGTPRELIKLFAQAPVVHATLPDTITESTYLLRLGIGDLTVTDGAAVSAQRIEPASIELQLNDVLQRSVPVTSRVTIQPDTGFQLFGDPIVWPPRVNVQGPRALVEGIESIATERRTIPGVTSPVRTRVALDTSGLEGVEVSPQQVRISAEVDAVSEKVLMGVPIRTLSDRPYSWTSDPAAVIVTIRGRRARLTALTRDSVQVEAAVIGEPVEARVALRVVAPRDMTAWATIDSVTVRRQQ
jgi:YbbR domain-containing protein